jgi:hypothetical protein
MEWRVHLARRRPGQAAAALVVIAAGSVCAAIGFRGWWAGALAAIVMVGSVGDFLFPIRYVIGDAAVEARGLLLRRRVAWTQVRRVVRDELGVKLSTLRRPSRLEAYRGIYLWFEGNAADVMAAIAHHMEAAGGDDRQPAQPAPPGAGG